jgi:hypothetical protein
MICISKSGKIELRRSEFIEGRYFCHCLFTHLAKILFNVSDDQIKVHIFISPQNDLKIIFYCRDNTDASVLLEIRDLIVYV